MPGYVDRLGMFVVSRRVDMAQPVGQYGWDGGLGTSLRADSREDVVGILMTHCIWASPALRDICHDFWTLAYQAIDD